MFEFLSSVSSAILGLYFGMVSTEHVKATRCDVKEDLEYCFYEGTKNTNRVVYFFHGFGNDTGSWGWNPVTEKIESEWVKKKIIRPHVVTISFGKLWWYTSKAQGEKISTFMQHFELEQGFGVTERVLYGDSMGGHNAYRFAHDYPLLFRKLALICPAVPVKFLDSPTIAGVWPFYDIAGRVIDEVYNKADPKVLNPLKNPYYWQEFNRIEGIHMIVSKEDHFGFYPGGLAMYGKLKENLKTKISFEEQDVFHCNVNPLTLAEFLGE